MVDRALLARFGPNGFLKAHFRALGEIEKWSKKSPLISAKHEMKWGGWSATEVRCGAVPFGPNEMRNSGYC